MAQKFLYIPNRMIDSVGISTGATIYFYLTGTSNLADIYTDSGLTTPADNPLTVDAGAEVPELYYATNVTLRVRIVYADGTIDDEDPWEHISANDLTYTQTGTGTVARTIASKFTEVVSVKDYGAVGDGTTDDTTALQNALDDLDHGSVLFFPAGTYLTSATLTVPRLGRVTLRGEGMGSVFIHFPTAANQDILYFGVGTNEADNVNGNTVEHLGFTSDGTARHAINMESVSRSFIQNNYFNNLAGAAVRAYCCLANRFNDNWIGACAYGLYQDTTNWTGLNGWDISGNYIGGCSSWGINIVEAMTGSSITGNVIEGCVSGGIRLNQSCHGILISGNYFEENRPSGNNSNSSDLDIAEGTFCTTIVVEGNYFNGSTHASDFYYPIRLSFARGCTFRNNYIGTGGKWVKFETASNTNNVFGYTEFWNGSFVSSWDSQPSFNFTAGALETFVQSKNRITHDFGTGIPPSPINLTVTSDFSSGWTDSLTGASTWTASTNGARTVRKLTRSAGTASVSRTMTIGARENVEVRGNFFTFAFDLYVDSASAAFGTLTIADNTGTIDSYSLSGASSNGWQTFYITMCENASTSLTITFTADNDADYYLGNERWYISADHTVMQ